MHFRNSPKAAFARNHNKGGVSRGQGRERERDEKRKTKS